MNLLTGRNLPYAFSAAVPSTSAVATAGERNSVNRKGKIFGCHHCGSRQIFSKQRFIADHMPPTKMANEMNENFWRKWLNIKVGEPLCAVSIIHISVWFVIDR